MKEQLDGQSVALTAHTKSQSLLDGMATSLDNQNRLRVSMNESSEAFVGLRSQMEDNHQYYKQAMADLFGGLEHVAQLQASILTQFFDVQSVVFYVCAAILSVVLTATRRTNGAR